MPRDLVIIRDFCQRGRIPLQAGEGEHIVNDLEDQRGIVKEKAFGGPWFSEAVFADFFDVHYQ